MSSASRAWGAWGLAVVLSVLAYNLSLLGVLFLVPLQWVRVRQGGRRFVLASGVSLAGIGALELALKGLTSTAWTPIDTLVFGVPVVLVAGWVALAALERGGWRFLYRLLAVTAATGLIVLVVLSTWGRQDSVNTAIQKAFLDLWTQVFQRTDLNLGALGAGIKPAELYDVLKQAFLGSVLLVFFLFWALTWRLTRWPAVNQAAFRLRDFRVPPQGAAVLLLLWGVLLLQSLLGKPGFTLLPGVLVYAWLNAAWIALVVHGLAGWGIVQALMERWNWPRLAQTVVRAFLVLSLLLPGAGQVAVLVGLPVLAVLELWINFREGKQGVGS